jgi:hypothetical protein
VSLNLVLTPAVFDAEGLEAYFAVRDNFACFADEFGYAEAHYTNPDTDSSFSFSWSLDDPEDRTVGFQAPCFRTHVAALEAEPHLAAFIAAFDANVSEIAPYGRDAFLALHAQKNAEAYREVIGSLGPGLAQRDCVLATAEQIEAVWRWNGWRAAVQDAYDRAGEGVFVAPLGWGKSLTDGAPIIFAEWDGGAVIAVPDVVTHLRLVRERRGIGIGRMIADALNPDRVDLEDTLLPFERVTALENVRWETGSNGRVLRLPGRLPAGEAVLSLFEGRFTPAARTAAFFAAHRVLDIAVFEDAVQATQGP